MPLSQLPTRLERCFLPARPIELEMAVAPTETEPVDLGVFDVEIEVVSGWCGWSGQLEHNFSLY